MVGEISHGIARYVRLLAQGLSLRPRLDYEPIFLCGPGMGKLFHGFRTQEVKSSFLSPSEIFEIPGVLSKLGADLYHSPSFSSLLNAPCPWVVTLHDLNHLTYGSFSDRIYYNTLMRSFVRRAKRVMTVSEFSRNEIRDWDSKLDPVVIPNAIDPQFSGVAADRDEVLSRYGVRPGEFFLCLSNSKPHKNVPMLVEAFGRLRSTDRTREKFSLLLSLDHYAQVPGVRSVKGISDEDLAVLYSSCAALLFPSLYEGFGLPPLEGAVSGAPILVSDIEPHREVFRVIDGRGVNWVSASDVDAWSKVMDKALSKNLHKVSDDDRNVLSQQFSVENLGSAISSIYYSELERHNH
jgi:glycosyltransferase involved in cell wall biosynthesis